MSSGQIGRLSSEASSEELSRSGYDLCGTATQQLTASYRADQRDVGQCHDFVKNLLKRFKNETDLCSLVALFAKNT